MIHSSFVYVFKEGSFADNFKRLVDCGFEAVEFWSHQLESWTLDATAKALDAAGLKCAQILPYFDFVHGEDKWNESIEIGRRYIDYSRQLSSPLIRVFTAALNPPDQQVCGRDASDTQWDGAIRGLRALCEEAARYDVRFCLEVHPGQLAEDSHSALRLIDGVGLPNLVANPQVPLREEEPYYSLGRLAGHIGHFHAHNWSDRIGGTLTPLAKGVFDWEAFLRQAIEDGFSGYVSIEHAVASGGGDPWKAAEVDGPYLREVSAKLA